MKLKQISVPIENSKRRLYEFTRALDAGGIHPRGMTLVDTGDFGELRILVSDLAKIRQILMQKDIPARVDDVVAVELDENPGQFARLVEKLMDAGIKIKYSYAFTGMNSGRAVRIFSFSDNDKAIEVLTQKEIHLLDREAVGILEAAS